MYKLEKVSNLKPGMILAKGIFDRNGKLLLKEGSEITPFYIKKIREMGIKSVFVASEKQQTEIIEISPEDHEKLREELDFRFSYLVETDFVKQIKEEIERYFINRKSLEIW